MGASHRITVKDPLGQKSEYFYNGLVGYGWYVSPRDYVEYEDAFTNNAAATVPKTVNYYDSTSKGVRYERAFRGRLNLECIAWDQAGA